MEDNHQIPQLSATTLLILEREDQECQVFVLKRQNRGGFLADALVFPGGVVESVDYSNDRDPYRAAAVREILEETGLIVRAEDLSPFSWWLTPKVERKRFNTRFFVAPYPKEQLPRINEAEAQWGTLMTPSAILSMHEDREVRLLPPTILSLEMIQGLKTFAEVKLKAEDLSEPICPELQINENGEAALVLAQGAIMGRTSFKISQDGRFS